MPRGPRIDYPGLLHHVFVRGIEKREIFSVRSDYKNFIQRLGKVFTDSCAEIFAWVLMANHFHLLIKIGKKSLKSIMRELLTGHAIYYNKKHERTGYLYQGRYKSIVCEEEPYFLELVRYIHLNPIRANLLKTMDELDYCEWSGHSTIMGNRKVVWQNTEEILGRFGKDRIESIRKYKEFLMGGISQGKRKELLGGGIIRSLGGIGKEIKSGLTDEKVVYDQRILGNPEFVENILKEIEERKDAISGENALSIDDLIRKVCGYYNVNTERLLNNKKQKGLAAIRAVIVNLGIQNLGFSGSELGRKLCITKSGISKLNKRGEEIVREKEVILGEVL